MKIIYNYKRGAGYNRYNGKEFNLILESARMQDGYVRFNTEEDIRIDNDEIILTHPSQQQKLNQAKAKARILGEN